MTELGLILSKKRKKHPRKHPRNIQEEIVKLLKTNPSLTMSDLMKILKISEGSLWHHMKRLKEEKKICHIGATKAGYWEIIKE